MTAQLKPRCNSKATYQAMKKAERNGGRKIRPSPTIPVELLTEKERAYIIMQVALVIRLCILNL